MTTEQDLDSRTLWKFTADGNGGGEWAIEEDSGGDDSAFDEVYRTEGAAYTSTGKKGFAFGGEVKERSEKIDFKGYLPGYVQFDFERKTWAVEEQNAPYAENGEIRGATATYVPMFGKGGVIVMLGGNRGKLDEDGERVYLDFEWVHFLDVETQEWHKQNTSGRPPIERGAHCAVGVSGDDRSFEM